LLVAALALVALAAAFAVPDSRSAILRFFHLGGVTIERVRTLPAAEEQPLAAALGSPIQEDDAMRELGAPFLPPRHGTLYDRDGYVSTLLQGPVLLSEIAAPYLLKKMVGTTTVAWVDIVQGRLRGIWLSGAIRRNSGAAPTSFFIT
jgi:hypothetical protein